MAAIIRHCGANPQAAPYSSLIWEMRHARKPRHKGVQDCDKHAGGLRNRCTVTVRLKNKNRTYGTTSRVGGLSIFCRLAAARPLGSGCSSGLGECTEEATFQERVERE
jgi:hypothetical protein